MDATNNIRKGLHPLLTVAAISLTVFSAVGVAALTGLLPTSHSTTRSTDPVAVVSAPQPAAQPAPLAQGDVAPAMPAAPAATPAAKPKPRHVAKAPTHAAAPAPAVQKAPEGPAVLAQAPAPAAVPAPVEAPKPVVAPGTLGRVEAVREVEKQGEHTALGPVAGGIAGAVLGHQFGSGLGNKIITVAGAAGGAIAGREIEKRARATKSWEVTVRLDDGTTRTIPSASAPYWHEGDRVRLVDGKLQPANS